MRSARTVIPLGIVIVSAAVACGTSDFANNAADVDASATDAASQDAQSDAVIAIHDGGPVEADGSMGGSVGCADGTREYLIDETTAPTIAGCSGGWTVAGLGYGPTCGKKASSGSPNNGCSAEDLCAPNWHVCHDVSEAGRNGISSCPKFTAQDIDAGEFYASAQRSGGGASCTTPTDSGADDIFGCGTFGGSTGACNAFKFYLANDQPSLGEWSLGSDGSHELDDVTKGPLNGGVLCCHD